MTCDEVMGELAALGTEATKRVLRKHGAVEPFFGVKIEDLKTLVKRCKADQELALALWDSGNGDARYLAGLICVPQRLTREILQHWAETANWSMLSEYTVAWCAAESPHGLELALEWIESPRELAACAGWATLSSLAGITADEQLDLVLYRGLLRRVRETMPTSPNRVRHVMNGFVIATGGHVAPLTEEALTVAAALGTVQVEMGGTACRVPDAVAYLGKMRARGVIGKKRKSARC